MQDLAEATEAAIITATTGHARGTIPSQPIANNTSTPVSVSVASIDGITQAGGIFTLTTPGYYSVTLTGEFAASPGPYAFVETRAPQPGNGQGLTYRVRSYFASPEDMGAVSATVYSDGTGQVQFVYYQSSGGSINASGGFVISYVGA